MVRDLRHRAHHDDGCRRAACLCPLAHHRRPACRRQGGAALPRQRHACLGDDRRHRLCPCRGGRHHRDRRSRAGGSDRRAGRGFRLPLAHRPGLRPFRPRGRGQPGGSPDRRLPHHRPRRLPRRRGDPRHRARPRRHGPGHRRAADHRDPHPPRRGRIRPASLDRRGRGRPCLRDAHRRLRAARHLAARPPCRPGRAGARLDHASGRRFPARADRF